MTNRRSLRQVVVALTILVAFLCQGTWALAGTTGGFSGQVTGDNGAPVAAASVKVASPSQTAVTTTDAGGHFSFLSLAPDSYTVTVTKEGYAPTSEPGVVIFADQTYTMSLALQKQLKQIANVTSRSQGSLVKPGTTASVYSVNAATAAQTAGGGGGYNLDSAYSAIYSQPGVSSYIGNYGFGQVFYIRGSSYSQTGYEFDGIPVNRAFDNYSANSLSNLGASETEVYTGGSPSSASSNTLGGYINQVIKTGTFPGYGVMTGSIGTPTFYHKVDVEAGGATPDRLFSYYVGLRGADSIVPTINSQNGSNYNPNGDNPFGLMGTSFNTPLYLYANFIGTGTQRGPWSSCNNGVAPTGSSYLGGFASANLGASSLIPACNNYQNLQASNVANYGQQLTDRENIINVHFGIPHKHDSGRDDIQLLYDNFGYLSQSWANYGTNGGGQFLNSWFEPYSGANGTGLFNGISKAFGGPANYGYSNYQSGQLSGLCQYLGLWQLFGVGAGCATNGTSPFTWADGSQVSGVHFGQNAATAVGAVKPYFFPSSPENRTAFASIPGSQVDGVWNNGSIIKLQYQKNLGSNAFVRVMGYTFYSDWLQNDPWGASNYTGIPSLGFDAAAIDYELNTHTRGMEIQGVDQINAQNLVSLTGNYVTASVLRMNNLQPFFTPSTTPSAILENGHGQCFSYVANTNGSSTNPQALDGSYALNAPAGTPVSCLSFLAGQTLSNVSAGKLPGIPSKAAAAGAQWIVAANIQQDANINTVQPKFLTTSLNDEFRPSDRWDLNLGVRYESYGYGLQSLNNPEANFWYSQINATVCVAPLGLVQVTNGQYKPTDPTGGRAGYKTYLTTAPGGACPNVPGVGQTFHPGQGGVPLVAGANTNNITLNTWSPRVGGTYTLNPDSVVRFSYGRYVQPTETAFEQVLTYADGYQQAVAIYGSKYFNNGFNTTVHNNPLQYSNNADLSYEQHFRGTDMSFKLTPFYRYTSDQLVSVSLPGGLAGGFNAATQQTSGVELQFQKGDPTRNGLSGQLSYTYTSAKLKYALINGVNTISGILSNLQSFWALTSNNKGQTGLTPAAPCYHAAGGGPAPKCGPGTIANPYYNEIPNTSLAQLQSAYPLNGWYPTYANYFPSALGGVGNDSSTSITPNTFAGWLSYKHGKWTAGLNGILDEGSQYGSPVDIVGIDPQFCYLNQNATHVYPGSHLPDYQTCSSQVVIPNPTTGQFDTVGQYRNPWQFNLGMQFTYDITPRITATAVLANVVNTCFGGSAAAWTAAYRPGTIVCGYANNASYLDYTPGAVGNIAGAGYYYGKNPQAAVNGTAGYPNEFNQAYTPLYGALPFQAYFQVNVKL